MSFIFNIFKEVRSEGYKPHPFILIKFFFPDFAYRPLQEFYLFQVAPQAKLYDSTLDIRYQDRWNIDFFRISITRMIVRYLFFIFLMFSWLNFHIRKRLLLDAHFLCFPLIFIFNYYAPNKHTPNPKTFQGRTLLALGEHQFHGFYSWRKFPQDRQNGEKGRYKAPSNCDRTITWTFAFCGGLHTIHTIGDILWEQGHDSWHRKS